MIYNMFMIISPIDCSYPKPIATIIYNKIYSLLDKQLQGNVFKERE